MHTYIKQKLNQNNQEYIKQKGLYNFLKKILINIEFTYIVSEKEKKNYLSREEYERLKENKKLDKFNFVKQERIIANLKEEIIKPLLFKLFNCNRFG